MNVGLAHVTREGTVAIVNAVQTMATCVNGTTDLNIYPLFKILADSQHQRKCEIWLKTYVFVKTLTH